MTLAFSDTARQRFDEIVARYPNRQAALLPVLHLAQQEFDHVSPEVMEYVAGLLGLPPVKVQHVATFYTMYNKKPVGRFHLQVCTNIACHLTGGPEILEHLKKKLGVGNKGTTEDGLFTLEEVECLAACGTAPAIQVNDKKDRDEHIKYHEKLDSLAKVDQLVEDLRAKAKGGAR
jgi:NADH-quinone oxidoreductase subunit E